MPGEWALPHPLPERLDEGLLRHARVYSTPRPGGARPGGRAAGPLPPKGLTPGARGPYALFRVPPRVIGAWEITAIIGRGGIGTVYRARHRATGEPAAV